MDFDVAHLFEELANNIETEDSMKARLVLAHINELKPEEQQDLLALLSKGTKEFTLPLLLDLLEQLLHIEMRELVASMVSAYLISSPELYSRLFQESSAFARYFLIPLAPECQHSEVLEVLQQRLTKSQDLDELTLLIESIGAIGGELVLPQLRDYLYSANKKLVMATIRALACIGSEEVVDILENRLGTDHDVDREILRAFANFRSGKALEHIIVILSGENAYLRTFAKQLLVEIGSRALPRLCRSLESANIDLQIHLLNVLGEIGDGEAIKSIRQLLASLPEDANVRFAAYEALALLPMDRSAYALTVGLSDSDEHVRLAAARAINANYSDFFAFGIKNQLQGTEEDAHAIVKAILYAEADALFMALEQGLTFREIVLCYLPLSHRDLREHYATLLRAAGSREFAKQIIAKGPKKERQRIVAVDDSRMVLRIYKSMLYDLGYEPLLFEFPESAIEWFEREKKPVALLTDLNMPGLTGIELSRKVRALYPQEELPILMVTTQSEDADHKAAIEAGVNGIIRKPFTAKALSQALSASLAVTA